MVSKIENRCAFGNWVVRRACIFSCLGFECQRRVSALIHVENSNSEVSLPDRNLLNLPVTENKNRQILVRYGKENTAT